MYRFRVPELFLGCFLTVAVFATGILFSNQAAPPQAYPAQQANRSDEHNVTGPASASGDQDHKEKKGESEFWSAKLTDWLLAVLTFFLALFTFRLWKSTDKLWQNASEDTRIIQRAYIAVEPLGIHSISDEVGDQTAVAHISINNVGNLPARDVEWSIKCETDVRRYRIRFPLNDREVYGHNTLPPGTKMMQGSDRFIFDEGTEPGAEGGPFLYIWGVVHYRDGFEDSPLRKTEFCHRYNFENLPSGELQYFFRPDHARIHRYGNDAN